MIRLQRGSNGVPEPIKTERLRLVAITRPTLEAEAEGHVALRKSLGVRVAEDWPPEHWEPHVRAHIFAQYAAHPERLGWHRYVLLGSWPGVLVGCLGAFPCAPGDVEIGYSVVPSFQRRGYGSEAAAAFVQWLLEQPSIHSVTAQSYEAVPESVKVMKRCGMRFIGAGDEAGTVRYRRFR